MDSKKNVSRKKAESVSNLAVCTDSMLFHFKFEGSYCIQFSSYIHETSWGPSAPVIAAGDSIIEAQFLNKNYGQLINQKGHKELKGISNAWSAVT